MPAGSPLHRHVTTQNPLSFSGDFFLHWNTSKINRRGKQNCSLAASGLLLQACNELPVQRISLLEFKYLMIPFISKQFAPRVRRLCKIPALYLKRSVPMIEIKYTAVFYEYHCRKENPIKNNYLKANSDSGGGRLTQSFVHLLPAILH